MSGGISFGGAVPVMAVVTRGADKVIQVIAVAAVDIGTVAGTYLGPSGPTTDMAQASPIEGPPGTNAITLIGTAAVAETATIAISAGVRAVTVNVPGVVVGGAYQVVATSAPPAGYALHDAFPSSANTLKVNVTAPLLAIGASYSIPIKVYQLS
jgi:hypothetical protein